MNRTFNYLIYCFVFLFAGLVQGQSVMDESVYSTWNKIKNAKISNNGQWISYELEPGYGDKTVVLYNTVSKQELKYKSASKAKFSYDSDFFAFIIHPENDSLRSLKLKKTKKEDLPPDTLTVLNLHMLSLSKVAGVKSFVFPEEWNGCMAYKTTVEEAPTQTDTSVQNAKPKKPKKIEKLVLRNLVSEKVDTLGEADAFVFAKKRPWLTWSLSGKDSIKAEGVYAMNVFRDEVNIIFDYEGKYSNLVISHEAEHIAFHADIDTTKDQLRPYQLMIWENGDEVAKRCYPYDSTTSNSLLKLSSNMKPIFSENGKRLFFGVAPDPIFKDTTLLDEEMVQVEVWQHNDGRLYPHQEKNKSRDLKKAYEVMYDLDSEIFTPINSPEKPLVSIGDERNANIALVSNDLPYQKYLSWEGRIYRDVYIKNLKTGKEYLVGNGIKDSPRLSPAAQYVYWYDRDSAVWNVYSVLSKSIFPLTDSIQVSFGNELNDVPAAAYPYGIAGWSDKDAKIFIYDRYDIWEIDPSGKNEAKRLTYGREDQIRYRYIRLDKEQRHIDEERWLLHAFDEKDKSSGYAWLNYSDEATVWITKEPFQYTRNVIKAKNAEQIIFTKEDFMLFPNLILTDKSFEKKEQISDANPQDVYYDWGSIELVDWTSFDGKKLEGLLVKPANFDSLKKYPVIVNFYERSSDRLHRNRAPEAHRSTINYSFYSNRGYIIFNPDIVYDEGHPGASCYDAVISGVEMIKKFDFVDSTKIGVQGHSWGGYQIAHLLTKTNVFKCAESGAPVVNMISAYGGIRWGTGMSRMFQYENTQSRLGATLWEKPELYIENSPIFNIDKVETPVLILHNDKDGAVPWYQGIEYFVALRRLNKEAWMLNYNGEPHWPLKWHNRLDFNIRMQQYFDYYLMDAPKPQWMEKGVPATEKGIIQGLNLIEE